MAALVSWPGMRPDHLDPLVVGPVGGQQRLDRQRARDIGRLHQKRGVVHGEREQRLHRLGAVDQRQALLGRERQRGDTVLGQHLGRWSAAQAIAGRASRPSPISGWAR